MKSRNMRVLWGSFLCALAMCGIVFFLMISYMNNESDRAIRSVGNVYMDEMSTQLQQHFKSIIELRMDMVEGIVSRTPPENYPVYSQEMVDQLALNGRTRNFKYLALYAEDGTVEIIYGDPVEIVDEQPFLDSLNAADNKLARAKTASGKELLMMGVSTVYPMESGKTCTAIIGGMDLEYINYAMGLQGDKTLCYTHIINKGGEFVIRTEDTDYITEDNYFNYLMRCRGEDASIEEIVANMKATINGDGEYSASVLAPDSGERRQIYCVPLFHSEWYLVSVMPHGTLDEMVQSIGSRRMAVSVISCITVMLLMLAVFLLYYRMSIRQMKLLEQARYEADEANKAKSRFLSNMSHDIRTPMNAIVGMTTVAMTNLDKPDRVRDCLGKITVSSKHLLGLINDILDMSKIESGKMTLNRDLVSLRDAMDGIVSIVHPQIKAKRQFFDIYIRDLQTEQVYCDGLRLNQVLLNLLSNALKFTPEGGSITVTVTQENSPKGEDYVRTHFWVKDTGIGMAKEFQSSVFDSFAREDNNRIHKIEGTGLGLAITKHIVDEADGVIELQSEPGKGTEFHVTLDMERAELPETEMILPNWEALVVDDDELLCRSAADSLNEIGVDAEWALSGPEAITMAEERHAQANDYHVILLDWQMPGMDGIETARELHRRIGEDVPLLLISAYDWDDIEEEARAAGISGFISKPLFKSTLYYGLSHYVDSDEMKTAQPQEATVNITGRRLLVAEDNELNWEVARELLSASGFVVEWAEDGQICLEKFQNAQPEFYDAILMDLRMPVMNGYEATQKIRNMDRSDAKKIPIIAMTADAFSEDIKRCLECGMNAHTAKPLNVQELIRLLQKFMSKE